MSEYVRPSWPAQVFHDASGAVIDYGNRWHRRGAMPPEDTYSVVTHPERFAPLHTVADALIEHLVENYDVTVEDGPALAADLLRAYDNVLRAVRVTPANPNAAPLTFVYTFFPGVIVHAGLLHDFVFPDCGCDACDETAETAADELERVVLTVIAGGYAEAVSTGPETWTGHAFVDPDSGWRSRGRGLASVPPERLREAEVNLRGIPDGWEPWPGRAGDAAGQPARRLRPATEIPANWLRGQEPPRQRPGGWAAWPGPIGNAGD